jgi:hypothetical protein
MPLGPMRGQTHYYPQIPMYNPYDQQQFNALMMGTAAMMPLLN